MNDYVFSLALVSPQKTRLMCGKILIQYKITLVQCTFSTEGQENMPP
jgi:hypothetical protein